MHYSVVIRTLGKGGAYYQHTLDSLMAQTMKPSAIIVYIAEGYELPNETVGFERYVYVKKGMVAQRALQYEEVNTEYMLFLDDDVFLPPNAVEILYKELVEHKGDVISPCTFANHKIPLKDKIRLTLLGREVCRLWGQRWAFKVLRTGGFSYNNNPIKAVYESQTNAGPCFFCKKEDFIKIRYEEELWLDDSYYAIPDDQVMFYKMYKRGLKVLTSFDSGIVHLDASSTVQNIEEKTNKRIYSEHRNKLIFWHRFIYMPERNRLLKLWAVMALCYPYSIQMLKYLLLSLRGKYELYTVFKTGLKNASSFIRSAEYKALPPI